MRIIVFDTETTGLFDPNLPEDHMDQPWVIQLGVVAMEDFEIVETLNTLVLPPDGTPFHESAIKVHGITPELCLDLGVPIAKALNAFEKMCQGAEIIATYNFKFDSRIMNTSARRIGRTAPLWHPDDCYEHCIMIQAAQEFGERIKLKQAYQRIFQRRMEDAHDAFADALAATEIFRMMTAQLTVS